MASKFAVDPVVIGAKPFLPANVKELRDAEGVQAAIFQCFRNNEPTPESLDAGFKVLRELNEVGKKLSVRCEARANRASEVYQSLATFRVGQVVQHKAFNVRGIVTGWDLDETKSKQVVEVLPDLVDTNEFAGVYNLFETIVKVNSEDLQLVEDKDLHRIINRNVKNFFDGYDVVRRKYIPSPDLSYWYECDLKALENSANAKDNMSASQLRQLNKSLSATQRSIQGIAIDMKAIIAKHAPRLMLPTETETGNLNNTLSNIASTIPSDHVGRSMADDILEEVHKCIAGCMSEQPPTAPLPLPSQSLHARAAAAAEEDAKSMSVDTFRQPLRRGGIYRQHQITNPALTEDATAVIKSPRSGSKASSNSSMGAAEVEKIYYAVGYLGNCFSAVDQLLQLRFQARGVAYHDSLRVVPEEETSVPAGDNSGEGLSPRQSRVVEVAVADEMAKQKNAATMFPAAIYRVGQIVRNTELGYRGVICGFDQRPGQNLLAWEGIAGLKYGQEQPIYKVNLSTMLAILIVLMSRVRHTRKFSFLLILHLPSGVYTNADFVRRAGYGGHRGPL